MSNIRQSVNAYSIANATFAPKGSAVQLIISTHLTNDQHQSLGIVAGCDFSLTLAEAETIIENLTEAIARAKADFRL